MFFLHLVYPAFRATKQNRAAAQSQAFQRATTVRLGGRATAKERKGLRAGGGGKDGAGSCQQHEATGGAGRRGAHIIYST